MSRPETINEQGITEDAEAERGIDLFGIVVAILSEWRLGLTAFAIVSVICIGLVFTLKPQFVATAVLLPQSGRGDSGNVASLFSNRGPGQLYIGLLQSRSVEDDVIQHAGLLQLFGTASLEAARNELTAKSSFAEGADTLVTISVRDGNAQDAARIANSYLEALQNLNDTMGLQESTETTRFFKHQLEEERQQLAAAEAQLAQTQKQTGLVASDSQTQIGLNAIAGVRAEIKTRQVQLAALLQSETEQNPEVRTLRSQIGQLQEQERRLEEGGGSPVGAAPAASQMPQNNLNIVRAQREVKYHDALVTSLSNQFEAARLNETFARSAFQVVDHAVVPERKAWPPRKPYLLASLVFGALMGLVAVVARLTWRRVTAAPGYQTQRAKLRGAFGLR